MEPQSKYTIPYYPVIIDDVVKSSSVIRLINPPSTTQQYRTSIAIPTKGKRPRTAFTIEQLRVLEECFTEKEYLDRVERATMAKRLSLKERQIKIWFQNRRMKKKRMNGTAQVPTIPIKLRKSSVNKLEVDMATLSLTSDHQDIKQQQTMNIPPPNYLITKVPEPICPMKYSNSNQECCIPTAFNKFSQSPMEEIQQTYNVTPNAYCTYEDYKTFHHYNPVKEEINNVQQINNHYQAYTMTHCNQQNFYNESNYNYAEYNNLNQESYLPYDYETFCPEPTAEHMNQIESMESKNTNFSTASLVSSCLYTL